jgi:S-adenosylmethionine/arginine decarboxylase-like enzyme
MKILIGPIAKYLDVPGNRGLTVAAIIETSHIVMHCWDECSPGLMQLDGVHLWCF